VSTFEVEVPPAGAGARYPIIIGSGTLAVLPRVFRRLGGASRIHVVSDSRVWSRWGGRLAGILSGGGIPFARTVVAAGERSKSSTALERVWRDLARAGCDRRSFVLAFGGGVVGDLAGFAAASVLRGVSLIQVPTTLLAMVDSSVGGKTGINLPEGKNLVGAFHQPRAVVMDLDLLRTLPRRELSAGWAEVIKTAAIRDAHLFRYLERSRELLLAGEPRAVARVVEACSRIKAEVVRKDERESGLRMILNFGHTLAHAIEAAQEYGGLLHGEAVAIGMAFAARLGEEEGWTRSGTAGRLERVLASYGLPVRLEGMKARGICSAMERDKKRGPRGLRWVLLKEVGEARISEEVRWEDAKRAIGRFLASGLRKRPRAR
jgi:3-dehydroquinate synthase